MLSTFFELAGFAALAVASFVAAGLVALLVVTGVQLLLIGLALDGVPQAILRRHVKRSGR